MDTISSVANFLFLASSFLLGVILLFSAYNNGSNGYYATPFYKRLIVSSPLIAGSIYSFIIDDFTTVLIGYILFFLFKFFKFYP